MAAAENKQLLASISAHAFNKDQTMVAIAPNNDQVRTLPLDSLSYAIRPWHTFLGGTHSSFVVG
jgi:hypothetical protein